MVVVEKLDASSTQYEQYISHEDKMMFSQFLDEDDDRWEVSFIFPFFISGPVFFLDVSFWS